MDAEEGLQSDIFGGFTGTTPGQRRKAGQGSMDDVLTLDAWDKTTQKEVDEHGEED